MTTASLRRLLFAVPRGFEDVAAQDILRFLPINPADATVEARLDTGIVGITLQYKDDMQACLQAYDEGHLWAVQRCMIEVGEPLQLSSELCDSLTAERKALPSKRSRYIKDDTASKKRLRARVEPLPDKQITAGEETFLELLKVMVEAREAELKQALQIWAAYKHAREGMFPESFALRFERRDLLFPTLTSKDLATQAGGDVYDILCKLSGKEKQQVDLTSPELEVLAEILPGSSAEFPSIVCYSIALPLPRQSSPHRSFTRISGRTSLRPARAYCLCLLHPDLATTTAEDTNKKSSKLFFDPCGGLGSIPLEIAAIRRRDKLKISCLSGDIELPSLEGAAKNFQAAQLGLNAGLAGIDASLLIDGRGKGRSGGLKDGILDGIITDLPFGIRELSASATAALYPLLLRFLAASTAKGAHGVFLTAKKKYFEHAMNENQAAWETVSERPVNVEGIQAYVMIIRHKIATIASSDVASAANAEGEKR